jgi:signal transduction histidine kinase
MRLVADAREAMPDGGMVEITTELAIASNGNQSVLLSIRDSGKRMRTGNRIQAFDPYYQTRPGTRNSGMSLAFVYQFVAASGGSVEVAAPAGLESGTRFILTFPAAHNLPVQPTEEEYARSAATTA